MIHQPRARRHQRRGATSVEMALVALVLFMLIFGIFEYCRFLFMLHLTNNAARDAVRYAVVHTSGGTLPGDPSTISDSDIISIAKTGMIGTQSVGSGLAGMDSNIEGLNVSVFAVDMGALSQSPPVIQPDPNNPNWTTAGFGQMIAVRMTGNYRPALPSLFWLSDTIPFTVTVMYGSEGN
jgi:Flp pilus assembly protein TadG